jgi:SAM-dependent methyltransferase
MEIVSARWGIEERSARPKHWLTHPTTRAFLNRRVTGDSSVSTIEWVKRVYFPKAVGELLSLGCGFGGFERHAVDIGIAKSIYAIDVSSGAIERSRKSVAEAGLSDQIRYEIGDLNKLQLQPSSYDAIAAISSVHHIFQLENLFAQCRTALRPGGLMVLDEYVGPSRFQLEPATIDIINRILALLPSRYRENLFIGDGSTIDMVYGYTSEHFDAFDPSEAVHSAEIIAVLKLYFDIVDIRPYGGGILHMLLSGIAGNFDETNEQDVALLNLLATLEELLERSGALKSDFAVIVASPKGSGKFP